MISTEQWYLDSCKNKEPCFYTCAWICLSHTRWLFVNHHFQCMPPSSNLYMLMVLRKIRIGKWGDVKKYDRTVLNTHNQFKSPPIHISCTSSSYKLISCFDNLYYPWWIDDVACTVCVCVCVYGMCMRGTTVYTSSPSVGWFGCSGTERACAVVKKLPNALLPGNRRSFRSAEYMRRTGSLGEDVHTWRDLPRLP